MNELFFSRAKVDVGPGGRRAERGATRNYVIHQAVSDLFGHYEQRPYLYRCHDSQGDIETVFILSKSRPAPEPTSAPYGRSGVVSLDVTTFPQRLEAGTRLDFEVRLNATTDVPRDGGGRSSRVDAWEAVWRENKLTELDQHAVYRDYLRRRFEGLAEIESARVTERGEVTVRRSLRERAPIRFVGANLVGTLKLVDSEGFIRRVSDGVGRSRSLGYGLICLSRPGTVLPRLRPDLHAGTTT